MIPYFGDSEMTYPISGPFTKASTLNGPPSKYGFTPIWMEKYQTWYRQRKPYDLPLKYDMTLLRCVYNSDSWEYPSSTSTAPAFNSSAHANALNKTYGKLVESLGNQSLWAVNLAERRQTFDLITSSATTLWKFSRELRKLNFVKAARILGVTKPSGLVSKKTAKAFGENFLKFHFGVEPLIEDIGNAIETLQSPFPSRTVKARSSVVVRETYNTGTYGSRGFREWKSSALMQTRVSLTNENLYKANQLGFVNPASFVWELIPFSFVVDWFVNVGQFLSSFSDFAGLSLEGSFTTSFQNGKAEDTHNFGSFRKAVFLSTYLSRGDSISGPTLRPRPWRGISPTRAATAISLLLQQLKG